MSSSLGNRLAGLPKIPKIKKKSSKTTKTTKSSKTTSTPRSPPKPASKPIASAPPPLPSSSKPAVATSAPPASASTSTTSTSAPAPFPIELSDDDTLSELESSSEEESSDSSDEADSDDESDSDVEEESKTTTSSLPAFPSLGSVVLPPLPPLPPLPSFPIASTSKASIPSTTKASTSKSSLPTSTLSARPRSFKPFNATVTPSSSTSSTPLARSPAPQSPAPPPSTAPTRPQPKPSTSATTMTSPSDLAYSPSNSVPRSSTGGAPQRMSLRQVLALSLQEAEESKSSRENTPDANEIMNLAKGSLGSSSKQKGKSKEKQNEKKKDGNESDSSSLSTVVTSVSGSDSESDGDEKMEVDVADQENEVGNMEKEEERLLRAEIEKKKQSKLSSVLKRKGKAIEDVSIENGEDEDETEDDEATDEDEEDLVDAWEKNVRAMEQFRKKRNSIGGGAEISFDHQSDGDSDVAITDLPPGNGFGVVTWSDYDSFGSEEEDGDDLEGGGAKKESEEDQLAEVLLAEKTGIAGEFEDELEQLFALSEAVVGPIRQDEYEAGDLWFEALSDYDGSTADDETEDGDDIDAEMIFGEDGELKRLFGARKKRRRSAVDSSAGESDSDEEEATESEDERDVELVRVGVHLDEDRQRNGGGEGGENDSDEETESYHSEDEETDSSCSDTDIYRYAPRTGALANLQAPTTADLASLEEPTPSTSSSSSRPKPPFAPSRHSAVSTLEVPTFDHAKGKAKAKLPTFKRRLPKMGTFDTTERKQQASESDSAAPKIVVVGSGDELAPSPFRVPSKKKKRRSIVSPRRERSDSRVSTTSGTSGSTSLDPGSNVGSPVLGNVVFPDFDLDSLLQASVFDATDDEEMADSTLIAPTGGGGATSSETDTGAAAAKPPPDFSRWNRIPIGAFRSRTMGGAGRTAPSQVLTAQAAATELRKNKLKRRNSSTTANSIGGGGESSTRKSSSRRGTKSEDEVASSILRDHKSVKTSLRHTLGGGTSSTRDGGDGSKKRKTIRSRMLTSPVLAPTIPTSKPTASTPTSLRPLQTRQDKTMQNPPTRSPPHAVVTTLLPFLFSPDDSISPSPILLSKPTLQAHHYLSLDPTDDRYWTCGTKDSQIVLARREIVECTAGSLEDIVLGTARYNLDLQGELKSLVPVSIPSSSQSSQSFPILDIILLYEQNSEGENHEGGGGEGGEWKFLRLSAPSILINSPNNGFNALLRDGNSSSSGRVKSQLKPEDWFETIQLAINSIDKSSTNKKTWNPETTSSSSFMRENRPNVLDLSRYQQEQHEEEDEFDEYGTRRRKTTMNGGGGGTKIKTREEMAEGEGTTPGAYGDSEDFWAGWSDNEDEEGVERDSGVFVNDISSSTRGKDVEKENDKDEDYWNGYGSVTNQVDDGRPEEANSPSTKPTVKTRSRRSSTVTPFNLTSISTAPPPFDLSPAISKDASSSFLTLDSPAQPASTSNHNPSSLPPLASAVKLSSVTSSSSDSVVDPSSSTSSTEREEEDENLRFALAGIWGLYKNKKGTEGDNREEKIRKFERIVGEVLRS